MANKRMVSKIIIDSDLFLDMPLSAQCLYFHLLARADDDGFIDCPKKILRMIGATQDDLKILITKGFLIAFESGVLVITHWFVHNTIQKDRYKETFYKKEKSMLRLDENKVYYLANDGHLQVGCQTVSKPYPNCIQNVSKLDTDCIQTVSETETQYNLSKDKLSKDKLSKDKLNKTNSKVGDNCKERDKKEQYGDTSKVGGGAEICSAKINFDRTDDQPDKKLILFSIKKAVQESPLNGHQKIIQLPIKGDSKHKEVIITQSFIEEAKELYPSVDVEAELKKMYAWLYSNEKRQKTRTGIKRFILTWLAKEQDRKTTAGNQNGNQTTINGYQEDLQAWKKRLGIPLHLDLTEQQLRQLEKLSPAGRRTLLAGWQLWQEDQNQQGGQNVE